MSNMSIWIITSRELLYNEDLMNVWSVGNVKCVNIPEYLLYLLVSDSNERAESGL